MPLAAVGVVFLMAGAIITHLRRHEAHTIVVPLAVLALAVLVAWGRFGPQSFTNGPARRLAAPRSGYGSPRARSPRWR